MSIDFILGLICGIVAAIVIVTLLVIGLLTLVRMEDIHNDDPDLINHIPKNDK